MKLKTGILAALISVAFASCDKRPENVLSDDVMCEVFADLHKSGAYLASEYGAMSSDSLNKVYMQSVFRNYGITRAQFDSTLSWYGYHIDKFDAVYDRVIEKLKSDSGQKAGNGLSGAGGDNLWAGDTRLMLMPRASSDHLRFSLDSTTVHKGNRILWQLNALVPDESVETFVAVDYSDGTTSYRSARQYAQEKINISFQVDSVLTPVRAYGYLRAISKWNQPVLFDSISLQVLPLAPGEYYDVYNQKHFNPSQKKRASDENAKD